MPLLHRAAITRYGPVFVELYCSVRPTKPEDLHVSVRNGIGYGRWRREKIPNSSRPSAAQATAVQ